MSKLKEILKAWKDSKNLAVEEDQEKRLLITIRNGKMEVTVDTVPDLDAVSMDRLYELQEECIEQISALESEEPDEDEDPEAYTEWEFTLDQFKQDLEEIEEKIEERLEEEDDGMDS